MISINVLSMNWITAISAAYLTTTRDLFVSEVPRREVPSLSSHHPPLLATTPATPRRSRGYAGIV